MFQGRLTSCAGELGTGYESISLFLPLDVLLAWLSLRVSGDPNRRALPPWKKCSHDPLIRNLQRLLEACLWSPIFSQHVLDPFLRNDEYPTQS